MATNNIVNRIELIGYMGAMPEMRFTANGASVINFSLATNRIWKSRDGESRRRPTGIASRPGAGGPRGSVNI